jgi:hypothetical protein
MRSISNGDVIKIGRILPEQAETGTDEDEQAVIAARNLLTPEGEPHESTQTSNDHLPYHYLVD